MAKEKKEKPAYEVVKEFRDLNDFNKVIKPGDDISDFTPERLEELTQLGILKKL